MATFEGFRKHWLWALIGSLFTIIFGVVGLYLQYRSTIHELGGTLNATFHSKSLNNKDSRTIVICIEDTTINYQNVYITPTFDNPDEFSLRDFSLVFETTCEGVEFIPSSFVKMYNNGNNSYYYRYDQDVLQAHMDTKNPFMGFKMRKDFARCEIISKVSFDGAANLFEYRTDLWFVYMPNTKGLSFDVWKLNCKQRVFNLIDDKQFDIYYIAKNSTSEYQFDVVLGSSDNGEKKPVNESEDIIVKREQPTNKELVTISPYKSEDAVANVDLDIYDYELVSGDSTQLTIFLNQPVSTTGTYALKYRVKDGWKIRDKYALIYLSKGERGGKTTLYQSYNKISNLKIYHRINPNDFIKLKKNYDGHILFSANSDLLVGMEYDDGTYYFRDFTNNQPFDVKFDKHVNIELFVTPHSWFNKVLLEDEEGKESYTLIFVFFGVYLIFAVIPTLSLKTKIGNRLADKYGGMWLVAMMCLGGLTLLIVFSWGFYEFFQYLISYIYLMI